MKLAVVPALALPAAVAAHAARDVHLHARQSAATGSSSAGSVTTPAAGALTTPSLTFTLLSTNPTAVPLTEIASGVSSFATVAATTTFAAGTTPTFLPNAPALPNGDRGARPIKLPTLGQTPDPTSDQVKAWIQEVNNSGVTIPSFSPTNPGGCANNTAAAADASRCWWTCGGCENNDVSTCPNKLTWGLTYDDGPALHTGDLLNYLDSQNLKATFFVVGSRAISYPYLLQEEFMAQHQIAVHTWSHPQMTTLTNEQVIAELGWSKKIITDVTGVTPRYWRPPFGDVDNRVRAIAKALGLETSLWTRISPTATFDTGDFDIPGGLVTANQALNNWEGIMANATTINTGFIVLEHDLFQQTVDLATGYILPDALSRTPKITIEPIITCLGLPIRDAYIETNDNSSNPVSSGSNAQTTKGTNSSGNSNTSAAVGVSAPASFIALGLALLSSVAAFLL
ncbi:uncharacterized protein BXZ73DRAFT_57018 [Epithele typhae]|uniref:uncharacterized protein n=1 Tax=Epithele typhae TaxID=378194 RepID=UPI002007BC1B|nr:uncharacterized protein BXZ73DRAFT_57018 [Epithele typhae]KAH9911430.1 hypothetical protein BXZ73DRAFT_57018 [Epithele typhae]